MDIIETNLSGVLEIIPRRFGDHRGFFSETWNKITWAERGIDLDFVQDNHSMPKGFLHGFMTTAPNTEFVYKCSDIYAPDSEGAVAWNDPDIGIDWGVSADQVTLSDKDKVAPSLADFDSPFVFEG